jgi:uncharacterized membrane protein YqiK
MNYNVPELMRFAVIVFVIIVVVLAIISAIGRK